MPSLKHVAANFYHGRGFPVFCGAAYGLLGRLLFSQSGKSTQDMLVAMNAAFVLIAPFAMGAITVYLAERQARNSVKFYFFGPWLTIGLFLLGTAITLLEGSICIAMAAPLFMLMGSIGGLVMGFICRRMDRPVRSLQTIAILPLLLAMGETKVPLPNQVQQVKHSVLIQASPETVWQHINFPLNIQPNEMRGGWAYAIGVPYPLEARTLDGKAGGKRRLKWQRGVSFDEKITEWQVNRVVAWTYQFNANSFPPGSMDEHVMVGGQYFDLIDTRYTLTPEAGGTRLDVLVNYRVSTHFNWYAQPLARALVGNTAQTILNFYKHRSEPHRQS